MRPLPVAAMPAAGSRRPLIPQPLGPGFVQPVPRFATDVRASLSVRPTGREDRRRVSEPPARTPRVTPSAPAASPIARACEAAAAHTGAEATPVSTVQFAVPAPPLVPAPARRVVNLSSSTAASDPINEPSSYVACEAGLDIVPSTVELGLQRPMQVCSTDALPELERASAFLQRPLAVAVPLRRHAIRDGHLSSLAVDRSKAGTSRGSSGRRIRPPRASPCNFSAHRPRRQLSRQRTESLRTGSAIIVSSRLYDVAAIRAKSADNRAAPYAIAERLHRRDIARVLPMAAAGLDPVTALSLAAAARNRQSVSQRELLRSYEPFLRGIDKQASV